MDGSSELLSLADVLRVGIDTARDIIKLRPQDAAAIEAVAQQMAGMVARLEALTREENGSHPAGK